MSVEQVDRNNDIYRKYRMGYSYTELADEYGLTYSRIYKIVQFVNQGRFAKPIYIYQISEACAVLGCSQRFNNKIQNVLNECGLAKQNKWRHLTKDDILHLPNLGEKAWDVIKLAQKYDT